jgi:chaperonin cofactor prefoldin
VSQRDGVGTTGSVAFQKEWNPMGEITAELLERVEHLEGRVKTLEAKADDAENEKKTAKAKKDEKEDDK